MRDRIEELIWENEDGEISGADRTLLAARLAQDASAYITGQVWGVNGGFDM